MGKLRKKLKVLGATELFQILATTVLAQGPPINTDTPIMLGLEGGGIRTFAKFVRRTTLLQDGDEIPDDMDRQVTVRVTPIAIPYNLLSDKIQVGVIVPFMDVDFESTVQDMSSFGIGDVRVFAKYLLYQRDRKKETFRIASKAKRLTIKIEFLLWTSTTTAFKFLMTVENFFTSLAQQEKQTGNSNTPLTLQLAKKVKFT